MRIPPLFPTLALLAAALCLLPPPSGRAQDIVPAATRAVTLRLLASSAACKASEVFLHDPFAPEPKPGLKTEIKGYLNHQAVSLNLFGSELFITTKEQPPLSAKDPSLVSRVVLPPGVTSAIVIFFPAPAGANPPLAPLLVEDTTKAFPRGSFLVLNRTPRAIRLRLEDKTYDFQRGQTHLIEKPPVGKDAQAAMAAYAFMDGQGKRIASGVWSALGSKRAIKVFLESGDGYFDVQGFLDVAINDAAPAGTP